MMQYRTLGNCGATNSSPGSLKTTNCYACVIYNNYVSTLQPPPLSNSFDDSDLSLAPSDVYAAYYDPVQLSLSLPCFLSSAQWCRARLLRILPDLATDGSRLVIVLAVDYGFMMTLPESQLAPLPQECRGIPPQVHVYHYNVKKMIIE